MGVAASYDVELTVPGGRVVPAAGLSEIAVLPTHRRRGVLRSLLGEVLVEARARARPVAVLFASEGGIYGRFGFAPACSAARYRLERRRATLRDVPAIAGQVRLLSIADARVALPAVFEVARRHRTGEIDRSPSGWQGLLEDGPQAPGAGSARFVCCYEEAGQIDGYAVYDVLPSPTSADGERTCRLVELVALVPSAEVALWRYLLGLDLVGRFETEDRPVDEPLRHLLADPRALATSSVSDQLWLKLLDPAAALAARAYPSAGSLVLEVAGAGVEVPGRLLVEVDGGGSASVSVTERPAELRLDATALATCYLGGTSVAALAQAGRVEEVAPGALWRASALFGAPRSPFCTADL